MRKAALDCFLGALLSMPVASPSSVSARQKDPGISAAKYEKSFKRISSFFKGETL